MTSSEVAVYPAAETALKNDLIDSTLITDLQTAATKTEEDEAKSAHENEPIETDEPSTETTETTVIVQKQPAVSNVKIKPLKISIPRISSRDLVRAHRPHSPVPIKELEQMAELMLSGPGARREVKQTVKLKNAELEECVKRAKKYAMEQSVRFVLVKQQQQQQKQQLDLIKKQQALLLMCR